MTSFQPSANDPAALAGAIRSIAAQARLILNDPSASPESLQGLRRRISHLKTSLTNPKGNPLARWLETMDRRLEQEQYGEVAKARLDLRREKPSTMRPGAARLRA